MLDYRHRLFPAASDHPDIVTIVIDDEDLKQIGRWPWPRRKLADLVRICHEAGAKQLVLDINLPEEQLREAFVPGVTDISAYEPAPELIGEPQPQIIDNDGLFIKAVRQAPIVMLPFYAELTRAELSEKESRPRQKELAQVRSLFVKGQTPDFKTVFTRIWPKKNFQHHDPDWQRLLQLYIWSRSMRALGEFSFTRTPAEISIPMFSLYGVTPPHANLAEAISNTGFVSVQEDSDGNVRRMPLLAIWEGKLYKQLAFAAACEALGVRNESIDLSQNRRIILDEQNIHIPLDEQGNMLIAWTDLWERQEEELYLPSRSVLRKADLEQSQRDNEEQLRQISDYQYYVNSAGTDPNLLDEESRRMLTVIRQRLTKMEDPQVLEQANQDLQRQIEEANTWLRQCLDGKTVLVGSTATALADFVVTPQSKLTPGIVVHRNVMNTILQEAFIHRASRSAEILLIMLLGTLMTVITGIARPLVSGLAVVLLGSATIGLNFWFGFGVCHYWIAVVSPVTVILVNFTSITFYREITEGRAKRRITSRFKQYAPPAVVDRIVSTTKEVSLAGEKRELSCFFSDLAGFTSISEKLGPEKTVSVLNIYLDRMTEVLDRYYATINKFEGDGIFAFFGAPVELENQARLACLAAIDTQKELDKLVEEQRKRNPDFPSLKKRVGISTGEVVVGDCGSYRRFDYTAIGDTVNLGARLESANKAFGSKIMICETTYDKAADSIEARYLGRVRVVGKEKGVGIYELCGVTGEIDDLQKEYNEQFAGAVRLFQEQQFEKAIQEFETYLQVRPVEKAAILYLHTCRQIVTEGPPPNFSGCIELTEK